MTADKTALQVIGLTLAALSVATILVAATVVHRTMVANLNNETSIQRGHGG